MVNAAANRQGNTLVFPPGFCRLRSFDPQASAEENLAGIGAIIAHEISHTFDDLGAQYDADGKVRNWWKDEDYAHFNNYAGRSFLTMRAKNQPRALPLMAVRH